MAEIKMCPYCLNEMRPLDEHAKVIKADSPNDKKFLQVICILSRYYNVEPIDIEKTK